METETTCGNVTETIETSLTLELTTRPSFERTRLSYDRTVMAAVRTAASLITFDSTAYKIFEFEIPGRDSEGQIIGPREFGITMILTGLGSLRAAEDLSRHASLNRRPRRILHRSARDTRPVRCHIPTLGIVRKGGCVRKGV